MSTENYNGYSFRYVHDTGSRGKVKVYVEKGASSKTQHLLPGKKGSPPYICFKNYSKPSTHSKARSLARRWADMNRR